MFEFTTQTRTREAFRVAHAERGEMVRRMFRFFSAR